MSARQKELLVVLGVLVLGWFLLVFALGRWQRGSETSRAAAGPELPHYPGTEEMEEQSSPSLGWRKYWFRLNEDYPSKSVFYFYRNELEPKGWQRLERGEPQWLRRVSGDEARDLFQAMWLSPDGLFQTRLEMVSVVNITRHADGMETQEREPGLEVYVTLQRAGLPELMMQRQGRGRTEGRVGME